MTRRELIKSTSLLLFAAVMDPTPFAAHADPSGKFTTMAGGEGKFDHHAVSTGWLPFEMPDDRHLIIRVQMDGVATDAVLDSGVGITVLDTDFAAQLGLHRRANLLGFGLTGQANGSEAGGLLIRIGNLSLRTRQTSLFDMANLSAATGRKIVAVIGRDLFGAAVVEIDFRKHLIAFRNPTVLVNDTSAVLPLKVTAENVREVPVSIEGAAAVPAIFDLGSDTPLYISAEYAAQHGLLNGKRTSTSLSAGIEGTMPNRVAVLKQVRLGETILRNVPVEIPERWTYQAPAFIGLPILSRFRLTIDFHREQLSILPVTDLIDLPFRKDRSGIGAVVSDGSLEIAHVAPGSPAAQAGLRVGDRIVMINGQEIGPAYLKSRTREGSKPAGTTLRLRLGDGRNVAVLLADYF